MSASSDMARSTAQQSTGEKMKQQGARAAQGTKQAGQRVTHSVMDQGQQVASQTRQQARGMVDQAQQQLQQQAGEQQKRAAGTLHQLSDQLRSMADQTEQPGMAQDLVHQASDRVQHVAEWLDRREPGQALDDVRAFARRHPGTFLTGAAVAGVLAGRLARNMGGGGQPDGGMGEQQPGHPQTQPMGQAPQEEVRQ